MSILTGLAARAASVATGGSGPLILAGAALAIGLGVGGAGAWKWQAATIATLKADHAAAMQQVADVAAADLKAKLAELSRLQGQVAALDATHYREMQDVQAENGALRAAVAAGTRRLSVAGQCPGGGNGVPAPAAAAGVGNGGTGRCELDRSAAGSLVAIAGDGDRWRQQLAACQDYVRAITGR